MHIYYIYIILYIYMSGGEKKYRGAEAVLALELGPEDPQRVQLYDRDVRCLVIPVEPAKSQFQAKVDFRQKSISDKSQSQANQPKG